MPIGRIVKISDKLQVCCIESDKYIIYVNLCEMPTGYARGKRVEYDISIDDDCRKIVSNIKLLPSIFTGWHFNRR